MSYIYIEGEAEHIQKISRKVLKGIDLDGNIGLTSNELIDHMNHIYSLCTSIRSTCNDHVLYNVDIELEEI